ncbi:hypothetical protein DFA_05083 [Cavenderia fasciculata]|uniref:WD40 repeat-containing protein n=1 Tax=Cavenderia fasciculata TaxID=261658 RepID=F4PNA0_CACFS|nr:uncharacterized protein DFA_05083 [Cavenderia fasciculata]EGG22953.1 hypothetical protein DFA_05083 [Cavenderia fasciculata]|eukprot:XP_004360804.1 hypothetical protein DFA_05083 [Cavenderia fasciculata]
MFNHQKDSSSRTTKEEDDDEDECNIDDTVVIEHSPQISTLEFDHSASYLAVGYSNGSISIMRVATTNLNYMNTLDLDAASISSSSSSSSSYSLIDGETTEIEDENNDDDDMFMMDDDYIGTKKKFKIDSFNNSIPSPPQQYYKKQQHQQHQQQQQFKNSNINSNNSNNIGSTTLSYELVFCFQAHESDVIQIKWWKGTCSTLLFLSSSVSSTKLWRFNDLSSMMNSRESPTLVSSSSTSSLVGKKKRWSQYDGLDSNNSSSNNTNNIPFTDLSKKLRFTLKRTYENEEIFNINSISINSDCQTFISSDELRVYLWDLNVNQQCFNIINLKPTNIQLLNEVIRVTEFHPQHCNQLVYGTSRGSVKLCDLRTSALCNDFSKVYVPQQINESTFSDYLNSILDLRFSPDGRYFATRNLESLSIWDMNMENQPIATYNLYNQNYLHSKLYDMYESSTFVGKFPCCFINQEQVITGSYDNKSLVWNPFSSDSFIIDNNNNAGNGNYVNNNNNGMVDEHDTIIPSDFNCQLLKDGEGDDLSTTTSSSSSSSKYNNTPPLNSSSTSSSSSSSSTNTFTTQSSVSAVTNNPVDTNQRVIVKPWSIYNASSPSSSPVNSQQQLNHKLSIKKFNEESIRSIHSMNNLIAMSDQNQIYIYSTLNVANDSIHKGA